MFINYCKSYLSYLLNQVATLLTYYDLNPKKQVELNIPFQLVIQSNYCMISPKYKQYFKIKLNI